MTSERVTARDFAYSFERQLAPASQRVSRHRGDDEARLAHAFTLVLSRPPTVVKGEPITLIAKGNGFDIAVKGRAEQDGFEGELISVTNMGTGAVLKGRLEAGKIVTIQQM